MLHRLTIRAAPLVLLAVSALAACAPGAAQEGVDPISGCGADTDCPANFFCVAGACQALPSSCQSYRDCNSADTCANGRCVAGCAISGCQPAQICDPISRGCADAPDGGTSSDDFTLGASPAAVSDSGTASISATAVGGFGAPISLAVSGAPSGATAQLSGPTVVAGSSATLSLDIGTAAAGTYSISVTGSSGALSHSAQVSWTIAGVCTTDTWSGWPSSFMSNNCSGCHRWATSYSSVSSNQSSIQQWISGGQMPPAGCSSADRNRILKWLSCGSPQ